MLGKVLKDWRWANRMGVREAAKIIGLSTATLSRIENDHSCDSDQLAKILTFLLGPMTESRRPT